MIYLGFVKTIRSVNHRFLLAWMKSVGLFDVVVWWIEVYLVGRVSRIHVGGQLSGTIPIRCGVLRGSVIDIFMFFLFVNELRDAL